MLVDVYGGTWATGGSGDDGLGGGPTMPEALAAVALRLLLRLPVSPSRLCRTLVAAAWASLPPIQTALQRQTG